MAGGYFLLKKRSSGYVDQDTNWKQRWTVATKIMSWTLLGDIMGDIIGDGIQTNSPKMIGDTAGNLLGALVGIFLSALGPLIGLVAVGKYLDKEFPHHVSKEMQDSISNQAVGLGVMASGIKMLYKTAKLLSFQHGGWWY